MNIINGKEISQKVKDRVKEEVTAITDARKPQLAVILVGDNQASKVYVRNKARACEYTGILSQVITMPEETAEDVLLARIDELNNDDTVDGILVQLPLPAQIDEDKVIEAISPDKDVDGFHPRSVAALSLGKKTGFVPCTPAGIMEMLDDIGYDLEGKEVVVVGRSNIVGKPVAMLALGKNATVTIAHSRTKNLSEVTKMADVLICAIGQAKFFTKEYVKDGAVVIDVGMDRDGNGKLCGDVDFDDVKEIASAITPVPGGVGPMTIGMLMKNTLISYQHRMEQK